MQFDQSKIKTKPTILFIAWCLGLGALIRSSVNSIWLAEVLGRRHYLYWGSMCSYMPFENGKPALRGGNLYPFLFDASREYRVPLEISSHSTFYPVGLQNNTSLTDVASVDLAVNGFASGDMLFLNPNEIDQILESDVCVVHQYLSDEDAISLAKAAGLAINLEIFRSQTAAIFAHYFSPHPVILEHAVTLRDQIHNPAKTSLGVHMRGTDKITESAVPSVHRYISALSRCVQYAAVTQIFVATDKKSYLEAVSEHFSPLDVLSQDIDRVDGLTGLHWKTPFTAKAYQNAVDMIIDIELLSACDSLFAFPGSQIYWWLSTKRKALSLEFALISVNPSILDRFYSFFYMLPKRGLLIQLNLVTRLWFRSLKRILFEWM